MTPSDADIDVVSQMLVDAGYQKTEDTIGKSFDDRWLRFDRAPIVVHVDRDRGHTSAAVAHQRIEGAYDSDLWRACLDDEDPMLDVPSLREQVKEIIEIAPRLLLPPDDVDELAACLSQKAMWRMARRSELGLIRNPYVDDDRLVH